MIQSKFTSTEFDRDQSFYIEKCISVVAYNNSDVLVSINKIVLRPTEMKTIVLADSTYSGVKLDIVFLPIPVIKSGSNRPANIADFSSVEGVLPARFPKATKLAVVLHVKEL